MLGNKIGFIGAGQMAKAFGFSLISKGLVKPSDVIVSCPEDVLLTPWEKEGCKVSHENGEVIKNSQTIFWAVKPQIFTTALKHTKYSTEDADKRNFHVSLMAGVPLETFSTQLKSRFSPINLSTARVMPNIAMRVGSGCSVFTMGEDASLGDKDILRNFLTAVGLCYEVPESQINAYCGLFSSGIGFMFPILEALSDGAVKMGIPRDLSIVIAAQTMKGAAELILQGEKGVHPGPLKDSVCSPGGTTIAGVAELEKFGVRNALIKAIEAATNRGDELGKNKV